jgi:hypothetical protein
MCCWTGPEPGAGFSGSLTAVSTSIHVTLLTCRRRASGMSQMMPILTGTYSCGA